MAIRFEDKPIGKAKPEKRTAAAAAARPDEAAARSATVVDMPIGHPKAAPKSKPGRKAKA